MPSKRNAQTESSPMRDAPEPAVKLRSKGFEPARTRARPAPKSSASSHKARTKRKHARSATAAAQSAPSASAAPSPANPSGQKKVKLATALRQQGLDERRVAQGYLNVHRRLGESKDKGDLKLFVDVLKENSRILEPPRPAERGLAADTPVNVTLLHNIPRPERKVENSG